MASNLRATTIGAIYMTVTGLAGFSNVRYACSTFQSSMSVNNSWQVTAYLDVGAYIAHAGAAQYPDTLLRAVQNFTGTSNQRLVKCAFYEEPNTRGFPKGRKLFDGYIISGTITYKTTNSGSLAQVVFICGDKRCQLATCPISSYVSTDLDLVVNRLTNTTPITMESALKTGTASRAGSVMPILQNKAQLWCTGRSVVERIAICIKLILEAGTMTVDKAALYANTPQMFQDVLDTFGGTTKLNLANMHPKCDVSYTDQLYQYLSSHIQGGSVDTTILSTLTSRDFALQLIPRVSCDAKNDYKIEILPITAWSPRRVIQLYASDIQAIQCMPNLTSDLYNPDTILVNFEPACSMHAGAPGVAIGANLGVYSRDPVINKELLQAQQAARGFDPSLRAMKSRVREFNAPQWLAVIANMPAANTSASVNRNNMVDLAVERQPKYPKDEADKKIAVVNASAATTVNYNANSSATATTAKESTATDTSAAQSDGDDTTAAAAVAPVSVPNAAATPATNAQQKANVYNLANMYAMVLFQYLFKNTESLVVNINPNLRYGRMPRCFLENSLGDTIAINLSGALWNARGFNMLGVLQGVTYSAAYGESSSASYTITLDHVRIADADWAYADCPIYEYRHTPVE